MWLRCLWNWFTGRIWKNSSGRKQARESLDCCKYSLVILVGTQKTRMQRIKARLIQFKMKMRTLLAIGLEAIYIIFW
jgi:phage terminase large subunit GpA-like protein